MPAVRRASFRTQTQVPWKRKLQFAPSHSLDYKRSLCLYLSLSLWLPDVIQLNRSAGHGARSARNREQQRLHVVHSTLLYCPCESANTCECFSNCPRCIFVPACEQQKKTTTSEQWKEKQYNQVNRCSVRVGGDETETLFGSVPRRRVAAYAAPAKRCVRIRTHTPTPTPRAANLHFVIFLRCFDFDPPCLW
jgi:hypothetical protein